MAARGKLSRSTIAMTGSIPTVQGCSAEIKNMSTRYRCAFLCVDLALSRGLTGLNQWLMGVDSWLTEVGQGLTQG